MSVCLHNEINCSLKLGSFVSSSTGGNHQWLSKGLEIVHSSYVEKNPIYLPFERVNFIYIIVP